MDKEQLEHDVHVGEHAQRILDDPLVLAALSAVQAEAIKSFKGASPDNERALQMARLKIDAAEEFINYLGRFIRDATVAESRLDRTEH